MKPVDGQGHHDVREPGEVLRGLALLHRLALVVELVPEVVLDLPHNVHTGRLEELRCDDEEVEVHAECPLSIRVLNLHDDVVAAPQLGAVHLAGGGRVHGLLVEALEGARQGPELLLYDELYRAEGLRGAVFQERGEVVYVNVRDAVEACRRHVLAHLDVEALHPLRHLEAPRCPVGVHLFPLRLRDFAADHAVEDLLGLVVQQDGYHQAHEVEGSRDADQEALSDHPVLLHLLCPSNFPCHGVSYKPTRQ
mmetsp:Transcript_110699/g.344971  ORF Transcript_110699/g.344971 Transcript_110699/m.344971 type:complete len:251 (-) Transcript_110699:15-767(-)